jgi:hypothetical protein
MTVLDQSDISMWAAFWEEIVAFVIKQILPLTSAMVSGFFQTHLRNRVFIEGAITLIRSTSSVSSVQGSMLACVRFLYKRES